MIRYGVQGQGLIPDWVQNLFNGIKTGSRTHRDSLTMISDGIGEVAAYLLLPRFAFMASRVGIW